MTERWRIEDDPALVRRDGCLLALALCCFLLGRGDSGGSGAPVGVVLMTAHTPGYEILPDGRVFSSLNWRGYGRRELQQTENSHGYLSVRMLVDGRRKRMLVHTLVAARFLPDRPSSTHEIRHLDGNKHNNHAANLAWGTRKDNADDRERHGRTSRGERHSAAIRAGLEARHV